MSTKNVVAAADGFRDPDSTSSKDAPAKTPPPRTPTTAVAGCSVEDVFMKPMSKPWTSPAAAAPSSSSSSMGGGPAAGSITNLMLPPSQVISSTPHHFQAYSSGSPGSGLLTLPTPSSSSTTTRQSLELFQRNVARYALEPPSRPSLTTDFALSALKNSFSMSSLSQQCQLGGGAPVESHPSAAQHPQQHQMQQQPQPNMKMQTPDASSRLKWERPFNSLTRLKERGAGRFQFRRSFGSSPLATKEDLANQSIGSPASGLNQSGSGTADGADWPALQANYTYLMSCDLIESCRSLNGEMSWDNRDLEHHRQGNQTTMANSPSVAHSPSVAVGCQTEDENVTIPELQRQLQVLREWIKRMESKVPKLILRPKWTRAMLERRIVEYKVLQRDIESRSSEFGGTIQRCSSVNPRLGRWLENRYHRLLLRILEWTYHLEALAKKPQEFWNGRRPAALRSPEEQLQEDSALPRKVARLDRSASTSASAATTSQSSFKDLNHIHQASGQEHGSKGKGEAKEEEMRQNGGQGGVSPPLPAPAVAPVAVVVRRLAAVNMGVYEFKHPDSDPEEDNNTNSKKKNKSSSSPSSLPRLPHDSEEEEGCSMRKPDNNNDSSDDEDNEGWIYSPNTTGIKSVDNAADGSLLSVRKRLSFDDSPGDDPDYDEDEEGGGRLGEEGRSWYQYSSSDSDWLHSGDLLDGMMSDEPDDAAANVPGCAQGEEERLPGLALECSASSLASAAVADQPEESLAHKEATAGTAAAARVVYDKEKVHKLMTEAEQMVSSSLPPTAVINTTTTGAAGGSSKRDSRNNRNRLERSCYAGQGGSGNGLNGGGAGGRVLRRRRGAGHNSECDASSELTSDGEAEPDSSASKSASLNKTFSVPHGEGPPLHHHHHHQIPSGDVPVVSPVVMRTRQRIKPQRPWSLDVTGCLALAGYRGGPATAAARWTASETSLNHLQTSPTTLSPCSATASVRPRMCNASTQKDSAEVGGGGVGGSGGLLHGSSSLAGLNSSGGSMGPGGSRLRRRRHSARFRTFKSLARRSGEYLPGDASSFSGSGLLLNSSESHCNSNATLQALRLSASAASATSSYSSGGECSSSGGAGTGGSQRSRRVVKSSTLTRLSVESNISGGAGGCVGGSGSGASAAAVSVGSSAVPLPIARHSSPIKAGAAVPSSSSATASSPRSAPSDGELGLAHVDETSNFSEQAWDNYLEPYASEAYSEDPPDPESARRLLEFGEDYRNDLDSLSDCPSSLGSRRYHHHHHHGQHHSHHYRRSPPKRPKGVGALAAERSILAEMRLLDSDSDVEDLVHVVETSSSQLAIALSTFHKLANSHRPDASQYAELLATCRTNVDCLQAILSQLKQAGGDDDDESDLDDRVPTTCNELKPVRDLIMKWEQLDSEVSPLLHDGIQQRQLQHKVQSIKSKLLDLETCVDAVGNDGDLQLNLAKIHHLKYQVESEKDSLLQVNLEVHSCVALHLQHQQQQTQLTGEGSSSGGLKEDVAGLYQTWDLLLKRINEKQVVLEEAEKAWKEIQKQLEQLKADIAADHEKVQSFLQHQSAAPEAVLDPSQSSKWMEDWSVQCDSGISSGSDGEFITVGEREKRLTTLKQLARKLDSALAPGNATLLRMNETLDQAQRELDQLQSHLAQLPPIKRSSPVPTTTTTTLANPSKETSVQTDSPCPAASFSSSSGRNDGKAEPKKKKKETKSSSYFWRIFKASLPFHLAFLVLILAACVMEPSCCNYLNTFGSSFIPKLSYLGDPPPT